MYKNYLWVFAAIFLASIAVTPIIVLAEQPDYQKESNEDLYSTHETYSHFAFDGYDERYHCTSPVPLSFSALNNLTIDDSLVNLTPYWMYLASGKTEQKALLDYIDQANLTPQKKIQWDIFLMRTWMKYPVEYVKTENGSRLTRGEHNVLSLTPRENATFQEIETLINNDIKTYSQVEASGIHPMWADTQHTSFVEIAMKKDGLPADLTLTAGDAAPVPDSWDPLLIHQLNHGYLVTQILPTIEGLGNAPAFTGSFALLAKNDFLLRNYHDAFTNLGYSSHFITDLGNPYHTPNLALMVWPAYDDPFSTDTRVQRYVMLHDAYEGFVYRYWAQNLPGGQSFSQIAESTTGPMIVIDPVTSAQFHAVQSNALIVPLFYLCDWHFIKNHNLEFQNDPPIVAITSERVASTEMETWGLVRFVTGGQPVVSSADWVWSRDGWGDWQHTWSVTGTQVGPNSEYGPVIVTNAEGTHGEHGTNNNLARGSTQSSVWRTFTDPSGTGWNTITFDGLMTASDVSGGRWMTITVNGNQVFGGTAQQSPPGNGVPFEIKGSFPMSSTATVTIANGQNPAWGPQFAMHYYKVTLSREKTAMSLSENQNAPFVIPDGSIMADNETSPVTPTASETPVEATPTGNVTPENDQ